MDTTTQMSLLTRIDWCKYGFSNKSIDEILEVIKTGEMLLNDDDLGSYTLRQITEAIRFETDCNKQNEWKAKYLPAATYNGVWDGNQISVYSCYTALDFDHIGSNEAMLITFNWLKLTSCVRAVFRTLKPYRLKAIIQHDNTDPSLHKDMYGQLVQKFGLKLLDTSCADLSRRNYLVWDKDIWINPNVIPFHYIPTTSQQQVKAILHSGNQMKSPQSIINILNSSWRKNHSEFWKEHYRANSIFKCACLLCEYGVPIDLSLHYFKTGGWIADDFGEDEVIKQVNGAYKFRKNEYGTKDFY